jgi:hypothetical protein
MGKRIESLNGRNRSGAADESGENPLTEPFSGHDEFERDLTVRLRSMSQLAAPKRSWSRIEAALDAQNRRNRGSFVAAASLAAVTLVLAITGIGMSGLEPPESDVGDRTVESTGADDEFSELVAQSRQLEAALLRLPARGALVEAGTASTIAGLEDQIAVIDVQLSVAAASGIPSQTKNELWRERVELMNALVYVRAAQAYRY